MFTAVMPYARHTDLIVKASTLKALRVKIQSAIHNARAVCDAVKDVLLSGYAHYVPVRVYDGEGKKVDEWRCQFVRRCLRPFVIIGNVFEFIRGLVWRGLHDASDPEQTALEAQKATSCTRNTLSIQALTILICQLASAPTSSPSASTILQQSAVFSSASSTKTGKGATGVRWRRGLISTRFAPVKAALIGFRLRGLLSATPCARLCAIR